MKPVFERLKAALRGRVPQGEQTPPQRAFDQYETRLPSAQNAIDMLAGWSSGFPPESGVTAGKLPLFNDARIRRALEAYGPLEGKTVLEVGPLEAMHTFMVNKHRPARIDAVEANRQCFVRCLVTREILDIDRARFHLGDINKWLDHCKTVYDFALASGVLYHMDDPAGFLVRLARRCDALFLWTHFVDDKIIAETESQRGPFSGKSLQRNVLGIDVTYHERHYHEANKKEVFCGGQHDRHNWMTRDDILRVLERAGYADITVQDINETHGGGPCMSVFARKQRTMKASADTRP